MSESNEKKPVDLDVTVDSSASETEKEDETRAPKNRMTSAAQSAMSFKGATHAMRWVAAARKVKPIEPSSEGHRESSERPRRSSTVGSNRVSASINTGLKFINAFSTMRRRAEENRSGHGSIEEGDGPDQLRGIRMFRAAVNAIIFLNAMKMDQEFRKRILGVQDQTVEPEIGFSRVLDSRVLQWWAVIQGLLSTMSLFSEPYIVAFVLDGKAGFFDENTNDPGSSEIEHSVNLLVILNLVFTLDIALTFLTPIKQNKKIVHTNIEIAKRYIFSWFLIDLIAVAGGWASLITRNRFYRLMLLLRLLKYDRLSGLTDGLTRLVASTKKRNGIEGFGARWFNLFASGTVVAHLSACSFFLVAVYEHHRYDSWTTLSGIRNLEPVEQYVNALYWAAATMVTTGYGDITSSTPLERAFGVVMLFIGAIFFSFLVGKMGALSAEMEEQDLAHRHKIRAMHNFLNKSELTKGLSDRISEHFENQFRFRPAYLEHEELLSELSPALRRDLMVHLNRRVLQGVPLIQYASLSFQQRIASMLESHVFSNSEYVLIGGQVCTHLYFVVNGAVAVLDEYGLVKQTLISGSFFGERGLLHEKPADVSVRVKTRVCQLSMLARNDFITLLREYPNFRSTLESAIQIRNLEGTTSVLPTVASKHAVSQSQRTLHKFRQRLGMSSAGLSDSQSSQHDTSTVPARVDSMPNSIATNSGKKTEFSFKNREKLRRKSSVRASIKTVETTTKHPPLKRAMTRRPCKQKPESPPAGCTWRRVRLQSDRFERYYRSALQRSRTLQAAQFHPVRTVLADVNLPQRLDPAIELCAINLHELWAAVRVDAGWRWTSDERDNVSKKHPLLVPWPNLSMVDREWNLSTTEDLFKFLHRLGYTVLLPDNDRDLTEFHWDFGSFEGGTVEGSPDTFEPRPFVTTNMVIPPELLEVVEKIAEHMHENWAAQKLDEGWRFGNKYQESLMQHHCLLPYDALSPEEKDRNRVSVRQVFAGLMFMDCEILSARRAAEMTSRRGRDFMALNSGLGNSSTSLGGGALLSREFSIIREDTDGGSAASGLLMRRGSSAEKHQLLAAMAEIKNTLASMNRRLAHMEQGHSSASLFGNSADHDTGMGHVMVHSLIQQQHQQQQQQQQKQQ